MLPRCMQCGRRLVEPGYDYCLNCSGQPARKDDNFPPLTASVIRKAAYHYRSDYYEFEMD